jgi:hypothetical protein
MGLKFLKDRPHGIVFGHPQIAFEQGGVHFGFDGEPVEVEQSRSDKMKAAWVKRRGATNDVEGERPAVQ